MTSNVDVHGGTVWTMIWMGLKLSLKFVSNIILTRLLSPDMFGIAAIGNALINGIGMFSDFGIQQNIVRSTRSDDHYYQTAWTVQLLRGIVLTIVIVLLAKPFAWLYETDDLTTFLLIVAASNLAMGFNNVELLRDFRHAMLQKVAVLDITAALVGLTTMVVWAWISPSYTALAIGAVVSTSTLALGTFVVYPWHNCRLRLEKEVVADLVSFGKWVLISTVLAFATTQMDRLALGKLVSLHLLGLYSIAWMWASMPSQIFEQWAHRVFFPLVSQQIRSVTGEGTIWMARRIYVLIAVTAAIVMYVASDTLVGILYTMDYQDVSSLIRQLSIVFLLYTIEQSYSHVLIAYGRPRDKIVGQILSLVLFSAVLLPAFFWANVSGVIALLAVSAGVRILWMTYKLFAFKLTELRFDIIAVGVYFAIAPLLHSIISAYANRWHQAWASLATGGVALIVALVAYRRLRSICRAA
ncbi:MAG: oligosaccharide flippase family protein [Sulfuricaulis sp.]